MNSKRKKKGARRLSRSARDENRERPREPSIRLTSGDPGRRTGSETGAVQRWSRHQRVSERRVRKQKWRAGSCLCAWEMSRVSFFFFFSPKRSAHLSDTTDTGVCRRRSDGGMYFYTPYTLRWPVCRCSVAACLFTLTSFTALTFNSSS